MVVRTGGFAFLQVVGCILLALGPGHARAAVEVGWDCYLDEGPVTCKDLSGAFFHSLPGLVSRADENAPALTVHVRTLGLSNGHHYYVDFTRNVSRGPVLTLETHLPSSIGGDEALLRLVALIQRGSVPFLELRTLASVESGVLTLDMEAPGSRHGDDEEETRWYLRPEASAGVVHAGLTVVEARGEVELGYSHPDTRFGATGAGAYQHLRLDVPGGQELDGGFETAEGAIVLARSLGRGFSVALLPRATREPQNNLKSHVEVGGGVEWVRHPFLRAKEANLGARYRLHGAFDRYVTPNTHGNLRTRTPHHALALFARLHGEHLDLDLELGGGAVVHRPAHWNLRGEARAVARLGGGVELGLGAALLYQHRAIHEPADPDALDPIATLISGSDFGQLSYRTELTCAYSFGNALLRSRDQRWR